MLIVDDHLALLAIAGAVPEILGPLPVATTYSFQYRLLRAVRDPSTIGALSSRVADHERATAAIERPPGHRLIILDPRASLGAAVAVSGRRPANLLLAELVGAAVHHRAAVRVTTANCGRTWPGVMAAEGIDFETIDLGPKPSRPPRQRRV